jgi:protein-disulfide isomerase
LSDENSFEATPSEEIPPIPQVSETLPEDSSPEIPEETPLAETPVGASSRNRPKWIAPAWFLFGIIVGIVGFAAYNGLIVKSPTVATPAESLDPNAAMRTAAREGFLEAIATLQAGGPQQPAAAQESQEPKTVSKDAFTLREANRMGPSTAKVTVVEFADYQCPFCERVHQTVWPTLKQYAEEGKISLAYKHSAFLGQESVWAAQASECAADQGKFWDYHDLLFARQNGENQGTFTKDKLLGFAKELNLDMTKFEPCLQNDQTLSRVSGDTQEGGQAGVRGTPTFFINGKPLVGAQPLQTFQQAIDAALAQ